MNFLKFVTRFKVETHDEKYNNAMTFEQIYLNESKIFNYWILLCFLLVVKQL